MDMPTYAGRFYRIGDYLAIKDDLDNFIKWRVSRVSVESDGNLKLHYVRRFDTIPEFEEWVQQNGH